MLKTFNPNAVILCGDYKIPHVSCSSDELCLNTFVHLSPYSAVINVSFSFKKFFQINYYFNSSGNNLDLVFSNFIKVSVGKAPTPLFTTDAYHPPLLISFCHNAEPFAQVSHTF